MREKVLIVGTRQEVRDYIREVNRGDYRSLRTELVEGDSWRVVAKLFDDPTPEEIEELVRPFRENLRRNPRYINPHEARNIKRLTEEPVLKKPNDKPKKKAKKKAEQLKVPQGWRE